METTTPAPVSVRIQEIIARSPGIHFRALGREAGLTSTGQLRHHIDRLARRGAVSEVCDGRYRRYFPANHQVDLQPHLARLARPLPRRIVRLLLSGPMSRSELRRQLACADSTLGYHLQRMLRQGDLETRRDRRACTYALVDPARVRSVLLAQELAGIGGQDVVKPVMSNAMANVAAGPQGPAGPAAPGGASPQPGLAPAAQMPSAGAGLVPARHLVAQPQLTSRWTPAIAPPPGSTDPLPAPAAPSTAPATAPTAPAGGQVPPVVGPSAPAGLEASFGPAPPANGPAAAEASMAQEAAATGQAGPQPGSPQAPLRRLADLPAIPTAPVVDLLLGSAMPAVPGMPATGAPGPDGSQAQGPQQVPVTAVGVASAGSAQAVPASPGPLALRADAVGTEA